MTLMNRDETLSAFRNHILQELDEIGDAVFGHLPLCGAHSQGAIDADLPELFKGIDSQIERLCQRYGVTLVDYDPAAYAEANPLPADYLKPRT